MGVSGQQASTARPDPERPPRPEARLGLGPRPKRQRSWILSRPEGDRVFARRGCVQARRLYIASTWRNAPRIFRPFRPVRAGGTMRCRGASWTDVLRHRRPTSSLWLVLARRIQRQPSPELAIVRQQPDVEVLDEQDDPLVFVGLVHPR